MEVSNEIAYSVEGNPDGDVLVFVHGWPDGPSLWRNQVEALGSTYRCMLVTLPNFGAAADKAGGYDFPVLIEMLAGAIEKVRGEHERVALVTHDWGAYIGYLYEKAYPERVSKMIAFDIGGHIQPTTLKEGLFIAGYQWALIACWLVGGVVPPFGNWLTRKFAHVLGVPARQAKAVRSRYNYPYFFLWRAMLLPWARRTLLGNYRPRCPVLFLYGGEKPVMFHSARWLRLVEESGGRSECIDGAGHWFMETHPERVNETCAGWVAS